MADPAAWAGLPGSPLPEEPDEEPGLRPGTAADTPHNDAFSVSSVSSSEGGLGSPPSEDGGSWADDWESRADSAEELTASDQVRGAGSASLLPYHGFATH